MVLFKTELDEMHSAGFEVIGPGFGGHAVRRPLANVVEFRRGLCQLELKVSPKIDGGKSPRYKSDRRDSPS